MPYLLPRSVSTSNQTVLVLAFGTLSVLEVCSIMGKGLSHVETPCERIGIIRTDSQALSHLPDLAGVLKAAPLMTTVDEGQMETGAMAEAFANRFDTVRTLSMSGYGIDDNEYETLVRQLLDAFRRFGLKKIRLLRPKGNELMADEVLSREAFDVIAFPYRGGYGLGPTAWVADSSPMRERGVYKPSRAAEISMSPRLASLLLNLAGLSTGQVVLDPFCGSGTILAEALLHSYKCLGFDSNERRIKDARRNLKWLAHTLRGGTFDVRVGDARDLQTALGRSKADAVVTEPLLLPTLRARPKVATATILLERAGEVYAGALKSMAEVISPGGRIVIVVPVVRTMEGKDVTITLDGGPLRLKPYQPGPIHFEYPVRPSFESTRWVRRAVYVFKSMI
jgi:SAM-dependent methyltransferase